MIQRKGGENQKEILFSDILRKTSAQAIFSHHIWSLIAIRCRKGEGGRVYLAEQVQMHRINTEPEIFHAAALNKGGIEKNCSYQQPKPKRIRLSQQRQPTSNPNSSHTKTANHQMDHTQNQSQSTTIY